MRVEHQTSWAKLEGMGDVIEAIRGICHAWRRESKAIQAYLAHQSGVPAMEFKKVGDALGQLARCCRWFPRNAYRRALTAEDRARNAIDTVVTGVKPQTPPARGIGGCYLCASRRGSTSATTGHEAALGRGREKGAQRGGTSKGWCPGERIDGGYDRWAVAPYRQGSADDAWAHAVTDQDWREIEWRPEY